MTNLSGAAYLALKTTARLKRRWTLMSLALAAGLTTYFLGASLALVGVHQLGAPPDLDLPAPLVARTRLSWLTQAQADTWVRPGSPVRTVETALALDSVGPLGRLDLLFLRPGGTGMASLELVAGRRPVSAEEVALPMERAASAGIGVGDSVSLVVFYPWSVTSRLEFQVVGLFRPASFLVDHPVAAYLAGETTFGSYAGISLITGEERNPSRLALVEEQKRPGATPLIANMLLVYPAAGRTTEEARVWLRRHVTPHQTWSTDTPALVAAGIAIQVTGPVGGVIFFAFTAAGVGVFAVTLLGFLDRRRELAIYRALGLDARALGMVLGIELAVVWVTSVAGGFILSAALRILSASTAAGAALSRAAAEWVGLNLPLWPGNLPPLPPLVVAVGALSAAVVLALSAAFPLALAASANVADLLNGRRVFLVHRRIGGPGRDVRAGPTGARL